MVNVKDNVHTSTIIASLDRMMDKASIYGRVESEDLYLLNTIYNLLNTMCLSLTNTQRQKLISIYNKLAFKSKDICTSTMLKAFQQPMKNKTSRSFVDPECITKNLNINYWKAPMFSENEEIVEMISRTFLENKPFKTRENFNEGSNASITGIGKICFFINTLSNTNITIKDILDNDITDTFSIEYVSSLNGILIISNLMYNSELMNLKITINA